MLIWSLTKRPEIEETLFSGEVPNSVQGPSFKLNPQESMEISCATYQVHNLNQISFSLWAV